MFNKKNLRKMNFIIGSLSIILVLLSMFDFQWRGASLVNAIPNVEIALLTPLKTEIVNLLGNDFGNSLFLILSINLAWYVCVVLPVYLFIFVKELLSIEKK